MEAPPAAPAAQAPSDAPKKALACLPCSKAKCRCDCNVPCERCFRNNLTCVQVLPRPQQQQRRGRPPSSSPKAGGKHAKGGGGSFPRAKKKRIRTPLPVDERPLVELAISRTDPGVAAGIFLRAFHTVHAEGVIVRPAALALMRVWRTWSVASGSDVTWGILDAMAGALGIAPWELEGPEEAFLDLPEAERQRRAQTKAAEIRSLQGQLLPPELAAPRADIDKGKAMVMSILPCDANGGRDDPQPPPSSSGGPLIQQACNAAYGKMVKGIGDLQGDVVRYRAMQILLLISLVAPADRDLYFLTYMRAFFTHTPPLTCFFKASYGDGQAKLYLMSVRRISLLDGRVAVVHQIEGAPKSQYVTDMPDAAFQVVRKFRRQEPAAAAIDESLTVASGGTGGSSSAGSRDKAGPASVAPSGSGAPPPFPLLAAWPLGAQGPVEAHRALLEGERQLQLTLASVGPSPQVARLSSPASTSSLSCASDDGSVVATAEGGPAPPPRKQLLPFFHDLMDPRRRAEMKAVTRPPAPIPVSAPQRAVSSHHKGAGGGGRKRVSSSAPPPPPSPPSAEAKGGWGGPPARYVMHYHHHQQQQQHHEQPTPHSGLAIALPWGSPQYMMPVPPLSPGLESALAITAAAPSPAAAFPVTSVPIFEGGEEELMNLFDDEGEDDEYGGGESGSGGGGVFVVKQEAQY